MNNKKMFVVAALFTAASALFAEINMPKIFGDNMVFQANKSAKVWGTSLPNAKVDVEFGWQKVSAKADENGVWSTELVAMKSDKNPRELVISENGNVAKKISNVLVGEVWVLGGQSNMEWRLVPTTDAQAAVARANYPTIRYFSQNGRAMAQTPQTDSPEGSQWLVCSPKTAPSFSGVGFYFAEQLAKDLDVPVALIYTPLGATAMESWIPQKDFAKSEALKSSWREFENETKNYDYQKALQAHKKKVADFDAKVAKAKAEKKPVPGCAWDFKIPPSKFSAKPDFRTPAYHYNAKVAPLGKFAVRGVLWYQGESDSSGWQLESFEEQFKILVSAWRENWGNKKLPFLYVQLASYSTSADWPATRWAQFNCLKNIKNVGMANIIDLGEKHEIHPRNKTDVGLRLENIALKDVYGKSDVCAYGPMFSKVKYSNAIALVKFDCSGKKLVGRGNPRGFEVLSNGEWKQPASADIKKNSVELTSPDGGSIEGVRYLWLNWAQPQVWLFNEDGLPASSFISFNK